MNRGGIRGGGGRGLSPKASGRWIKRDSRVESQTNDASSGLESGSMIDRGKFNNIAPGSGSGSFIGKGKFPDTSPGPESGSLTVRENFLDSSPGPESGSVQLGGKTPSVSHVNEYFASFPVLAHSSNSATPKLSELSIKSDLNFGGNEKVLFLNVKEENMCSPYITFHQSLKEVRSGKNVYENTEDDVELKISASGHNISSFDIFMQKNESGVKLKPSLLVKNKERRIESKFKERGENIEILRPGMILLKGYLSLTDQVKLMKTCRDFGVESGGFYRPGYSDGAKLHLMMMCLGKNWDPETSRYSDERPTDRAKPPVIPDEFLQMVQGAIQKCQKYLESQTNGKDVLPSMSPNICIVNFYSESGKLGLHQDKDESKESLERGLPVVSFSIGDAAEFLYGDQRNVDEAKKIDLKSGDALVFGGKARHIFHGVSSIKAGSAPELCLEESKLRPGRLNLTFREY